MNHHPMARSRTLVVASVLALVALPLMVWSIFDPHVWPVLVALSVGQVLGTISFVMFLYVVARDIHLRSRLRDAGGSFPPSN